jgi:hypothetical protein
VPWVYIRSKLAERWHVPPWIVDEADPREIQVQLDIMRIEAEVEGS